MPSRSKAARRQYPLPLQFKYTEDQWATLLTLLLSGQRGARLQKAPHTLSDIRLHLEQATHAARIIILAEGAGAYDYREHTKVIINLQNLVSHFSDIWSHERKLILPIVTYDTMDNPPPAAARYQETELFFGKLTEQLGRLVEYIEEQKSESRRILKADANRKANWGALAVDGLLQACRRVWLIAHDHAPLAQSKLNRPGNPFSAFSFEVASHIEHGVRWGMLRTRLNRLRERDSGD